MKFKLIILIGLMCIGFKGHSQDAIRFGITANPGLVWVKPDNTNISSNGVRFGFDFGLVFDYVFGQQDRYAFNSGINLLISGARLKGTAADSSGVTSDLTARINYLEIPLTVKLRSNEVGYLTYYGQLGLTPQFAVRSRADYTLTDSVGMVTADVKNAKLRDIPVEPVTIDKVRPFNLGLVVEAGIEYALTENTALVGGIFFNAGFLDMFKDADSERVVSRSIGLRISVLF